MTNWSPPAGTSGDISLVRTTLATARPNSRDCPTFRSSEARPLLHANPAPLELTEKLQDFTLKVFMDALDLIEHDQRDPESVIEQLWRTNGTFDRYKRIDAHPVLLAWSEQATRRYVDARREDQRVRQEAGFPATFPVRHKWVYQQRPKHVGARGADTYEITAWGRRYGALDGSTRELWLLSVGNAKDDRPEAEKAAAAFVASHGVPSTRGWKARHEIVPARTLHPGLTRPPDRVRIVEFGCGDGVFTELLDQGRDEISRRFTEYGAPALARTVDRSEARPGSSCVGCKALAGCTSLPRSPGLLRITPADPPRARRSVSITDLRYYRDCPAKYHATRQLKLRSTRQESPEIRRGRAVDSVLNTRHGVTPHRSCGLLPGPMDPSAWSAGDVHLVGKEAEDGAAMLEQHAYVCPLEGLGSNEEVHVQYQATCYDPELDLVLIATPDLLHTRRGGWTWRETKTANNRLYEGKALMESYPQLALGVLMLSAGVLGGDIGRSRVELELLHVDDLTFEELDPSRPRVVDEAREVIASLARPWADDRLFPETPGRHCGSCEAQDWCRPGIDHLTATVREA